MKEQTIEQILAKHPNIDLVEFFKWKFRFIPVQLKLINRSKINQVKKKQHRNNSMLHTIKENTNNTANISK